MTYPTISDQEHIQLCYEVLRDAGQSHNMAEILAHRRAPGIRTDATMTRGWKTDNPFGESKMGQLLFRMAKKKAEKAGVSIEGKRYLSSLASCPLDPEAWVSAGDGFASDVKRIADKRGLKVTGILDHTSPGYDDAPGCANADAPYRVSEKIVNERVSEMCEDNPDLAPTPREKLDLADKVRDQLSPNHD